MYSKVMKVSFIVVLLAACYALAEQFGAGSLVVAGVVVGTPTNIGGLNATGIRRIMHEKKLREDSVWPSVFTVLESAMKVNNGEIVMDKAGVFMKIMGGPGGGGQSVRLAMSLPLRKAPQWGTSQTVLGNEDEADLLWCELFYNEIKKGVKFKKFGYDYNDTAYLGYIEKYGKRVTDFMAELWDARCHQALVLGKSEELTQDPINLSQSLNPNWILPNLDDADFPLWDIDAITRTNGSADADNYYSARTYSGSTSFVENVAASLMAAAGTGSTSKAVLNVDTLAMISEYTAAGLMIDSILLDGQWTYCLLVPSRVKGYMMNPKRAGSVAEHFKETAEYKDPTRMTIPGEFGRLFGNLVCIENLRGPTITVGGSSGAYTIKPGFVWPGNNDDRNNAAWSNTSGSTNYVFDMVIGLGANALAQYTMDPLITSLQESTEYGQIQGRGAYLGEGLQLPFFDKDAASRVDGTSKTLKYKGSFLVPVSRTPRTTVV